MKCRVRNLGHADRRGFAVLSVLFVLIALLILCAPFLMTARNASKASTQLSDKVQTRLALDAAIRHARANLGGSHPSRDATPYWDDRDELTVKSTLEPGFWNNHDPRAVMWDVDAFDVAGRIDVGSAPPQMFANMLGCVTRLAEPLKSKAKAIAVLSTFGFEPEGFLWIGAELVRYTSIEDGKFAGLTRGLTANVDKDGNWAGCGPSPALDHSINLAVVDQRAFAIPMWRIADASKGLRSFDAIEQMRDSAPLALSGVLGQDFSAALEQRSSVYGGVRAGPKWQRAVRITNALQAGEDCVVRVAERRNFNPGTTVMITDGRTIEFGIVLALQEADGIKLFNPVRMDYLGYRATIAPLARRPVNVNVASVEVLEALFLNLQIINRSSRITRDEAGKLAALAIESRPLLGLEDFLRRVVLPAAGIESLPKDAPVTPAVLASATGNLIDADDALALYANALNANDERLSYSTMPLSFVSRDVYAMHARAAVNAPSGVLRSSGVREEVALIIPQDDLLTLWARQEDFEEAIRLTSDAPLWATGPNATSRFDGLSVPPSRLFAHFGTWKDQPYEPGRTVVAADELPNPQHVFASRKETAWSQLMPSRVEETAFTNGRMLHFDNETRDLEGRYLPDEAITYLPGDKKVQWAPLTGGLARGLTASFWIRPRAIGDGTYVDFGMGSLDSDRVWLGIEGPDLVLRVIDGPGDNPATVLKEFGEARFELAAGTGPGLAQDTWSHIEIDVRGNRPDQISLSIDGRALGVRTPGLTRLTSTFGVDALVFTVESGEGFPDRGVARIGNELIEYKRQGPTTFVAQHEVSGVDAGFGGRLARNRFTLPQTNPVEPGTNDAKGVVNENHATGTPVELYGYSLPLASNVPAGEGVLPQAIGRFAVGMVVGMELDGSSNPGEPISVTALPFPLGLGTDNTRNLTALKLLPADPAPMTTATMMAAFQKTGGYALLMQLGPNTNLLTLNSSILCGTEVVHYSGWTGDRLFIDKRHELPTQDLVPGVANQSPHAFVLTWQVQFVDPGPPPVITDPNTEFDRRIFVVPISINVGAGTNAFLIPQVAQGNAVGRSEFAQITEPGAAELTEWVRYDRIEQNQLVRSDPLALAHCRAIVTGGPRGTLPAPPPDPGPPEAPVSGAAAPIGPLNAAQPVAQNPPGYVPAQWLPSVGVDEDLNSPVTRAARTALQFRGVFGTYSHDHAASTKVLPVWRVKQNDVDNGLPGHGDAAFLVDALPSDPGWPLEVQRAYRPSYYMETDCLFGVIPTPPVAGIAVRMLESGVGENAGLNGARPNFPRDMDIFVAANALMRAPIAAGTSQTTNITQVETRLHARLSKFPSGERPREATRVEIGRALNGSGVPSALIDEIAFGNPHFGEGTVHAEAAQAAQLAVTVPFGPGSPGFHAYPSTIRVAQGLLGDTHIFLNDLPKDAGLLRIGSEILCYDSIDSSSGLITIATSGRGLLGTTEETHEAGETATWLETRIVTTLAASLSPGSAIIQLEDATDFPSQGTLLIGGELIHYTHLAGTQLEMPRGSSKPGAMDDNGGGIFRGRFGTAPSAHSAGEPVILFPFRYWDRWADRADAPELAYFGFSIDQPNAFWRDVFFQADEPPGTKIEVLQRSNPLTAWDDEPSADLSKNLARLEQGLKDGSGRAIGIQRDSLEWRVYVRYAPNAFDYTNGLSHGWKRTPRLTQFGVEYLGPGLTLRRVDE